jgi:hypothetical protein
MDRFEAPRLGRFPEEAVRRAPQRSDWSPQQWRALERLDSALAGERLDEKTVFWRRKWVEWFLRWSAPEDYRRATPAVVARFIERARQRGKEAWQSSRVGCAHPGCMWLVGTAHPTFFGQSTSKIRGRRDV